MGEKAPKISNKVYPTTVHRGIQRCNPSGSVDTHVSLRGKPNGRTNKKKTIFDDISIFFFPK